MGHGRIGIDSSTSGTAKEVGDRAQERDGMFSVLRDQPGFKAYGLAET
jgi:hypothetical protein